MRVSRAVASIVFVSLVVIVIVLFPGVTSWAESIGEIFALQTPYEPSPELFGNDSLSTNASYTQPAPARLIHLHPDDVDAMNIRQIPRIIHQVCVCCWFDIFFFFFFFFFFFITDLEEGAAAVVGCVWRVCPHELGGQGHATHGRQHGDLHPSELSIVQGDVRQAQPDTARRFHTVPCPLPLRCVCQVSVLMCNVH